MRALSALIGAFSIPIVVLNFFGGIVGGIWLIYLGMWKPIGVSVAILFVGAFSLGFVLMPGLLFLLPFAKTEGRGSSGVTLIAGFLSLAYTTAVIVIWAFLILKVYSRMGPPLAQWPLLLLSYGAATGPWAYMASKEQHGPEGGNSYSGAHVFFLSAGYIVAMFLRLLGEASFETCLWVLIAAMSVGLIFQACAAAEEDHNRRAMRL